MLKPKKRKDRIRLMRAKNGGYIIRTDKIREVLTKNDVESILLIHDPECRNHKTCRTVRLVAEWAGQNKHRSLIKTAVAAILKTAFHTRLKMKKELSWESFKPCDTEDAQRLARLTISRTLENNG